MSSASLELTSRTGLLIDTNLLVLFIVGSVNINRIETFKRTSQYDRRDYKLLVRILDAFSPLYTLAHVMAEVSNLTDLSGPELLKARNILKEMLTILQEPPLPSVLAAQSKPYDRLGLVDAAITSLARECKCAVLTDDLDLYTALRYEGIEAYKFTHLQARAWGVP
jgi:hypothetical protein